MANSAPQRIRVLLVQIVVVFFRGRAALEIEIFLLLLWNVSWQSHIITVILAVQSWKDAPPKRG